MNYYKITNKKEIHNHMKYKIGLNIDCEIFSPFGDCKSGGIYFSREDILAFIGYGCWIRKVTLPKDAQVYENPSIPKKWKADKVILGKREKITVKTIKRLVEEGADIHTDNDFAVRWASSFGHLDVVKFLVKKGADIHADNNYAVQWASENGHLDVVKFLVKKGADIHTDNDFAVRLASASGHLDVVKFLVKKGADIHACNDLAVRWASSFGHLDVVKFLVKKGADIHADNNYAIRLASENGHLDVVKFLKSIK